jgi:hypothetical protein
VLARIEQDDMLGGDAARSTAGRSSTASLSNSPVAKSFGTRTART